MSEVLFVFVIIIAGLILVAAGVGIGYHLKKVWSELRAMRSRVASLEEDGGIPDLAIVDAKTPKEVNEHKFDETEEESAIITAKKPVELAREKDRKLQEDLDRYGR